MVNQLKKRLTIAGSRLKIDSLEPLLLFGVVAVFQPMYLYTPLLTAPFYKPKGSLFLFACVGKADNGFLR